MSSISEILRAAADTIEMVNPPQDQVLSVEITTRRKAVMVHIFLIDEFLRIVDLIKPDALLLEDGGHVSAVSDGVRWVYVPDNRAQVNEIITTCNLPVRVTE
jgi:hypothetical protein